MAAGSLASAGLADLVAWAETVVMVAAASTVPMRSWRGAQAAMEETAVPVAPVDRAATAETPATDGS